MEIAKFYSSYVNGDCKSVWKELSFKDYRSFSIVEQEGVNKIINEALERIDYNFKIVYNTFVEHGFVYQNFGGINTINQPYVLQNIDNNSNKLKRFYENKHNDLNIPFFFASFCSFFKVVDFRGSFKFDVPLFLDPFFIESFNSFNEIEELIFERDYRGEPVFCCMFSPDQYVKENESGDLGACIKLSELVYIDDFVINYHDDFQFTFIEYLRFCFEWGCLPSLFWASENEQKPFLQILKQVRNQLKPF